MDQIFGTVVGMLVACIGGSRLASSLRSHLYFLQIQTRRKQETKQLDPCCSCGRSRMSFLFPAKVTGHSIGEFSGWGFSHSFPLAPILSSCFLSPSFSSPPFFLSFSPSPPLSLSFSSLLCPSLSLSQSKMFLEHEKPDCNVVKIGSLRLTQKNGRKEAEEEYQRIHRVSPKWTTLNLTFYSKNLQSHQRYK